MSAQAFDKIFIRLKDLSTLRSSIRTDLETLRHDTAAELNDLRSRLQTLSQILEVSQVCVICVGVLPPCAVFLNIFELMGLLAVRNRPLDGKMVVRFVRRLPSSLQPNCASAMLPFGREHGTLELL